MDSSAQRDLFFVNNKKFSDYYRLNTSGNKHPVHAQGGKMRYHYLFALSAISLSAASCTPQRTGFDIKQFQQVASSVQFDQVKMQLSRSIDNPYDLPTYTSVGQTMIKSGAGAEATALRTLSPPGAIETFSLKLGAIPPTQSPLSQPHHRPMRSW
ncbi:hypothetical protein GOD93_24955 [Sinorhizobium medicae]|nr:hypothetical protein [Sinorhizobium medicae]